MSTSANNQHQREDLLHLTLEGLLPANHKLVVNPSMRAATLFSYPLDGEPQIVAQQHFTPNGMHALGYRCLADQGSYPLITQGMESWVTFVLSQRPFTIVLAIQEALALCQALGIEVPELSGEVTRLGRADPMPL